MTTQPLCVMRHHTEKSRIEELTTIEQTEKKRKKKNLWGWNSHQPLRCTGQLSEPYIADSKDMTYDHRRFPLSL